MATLAEIQADRKAKAKKKRDAAKGRTQDFLTKYKEKQENIRTRRMKRASLKNDLKGEERLAESRTFRGQGKETVADLKLLAAENSKKTQAKADKGLDRQKRVKQLKKEGKTATQIFRDRLDKKPVADKKPVVKKPVAKKKVANNSKKLKDMTGIVSKDVKDLPPLTEKKANNKPKPTPKKEMTPREMGRNQMNAARKSMGMKHGGPVERTKMGRVRTAKASNINGIAQRGLTRAKHK